jgi:hypothetical protein
MLYRMRRLQELNELFGVASVAWRFGDGDVAWA